jgi:hypothetical protein
MIFEGERIYKTFIETEKRFYQEHAHVSMTSAMGPGCGLVGR